MRTLLFGVLAILFFVLMTGPAFAIGEAFLIETSGTEYCDNFSFVKFNAKNNVNLWAYIQSDSEVVISFTPTFQSGTTFSMTLTYYYVTNTKTSFIGTIQLEDESYLTMQGITTFDKYGTVKSLKGAFIQNGVVHAGCFSSGNFYSSKRLW